MALDYLAMRRLVQAHRLTATAVTAQNRKVLSVQFRLRTGSL